MTIAIVGGLATLVGVFLLMRRVLATRSPADAQTAAAGGVGAWLRPGASRTASPRGSASRGARNEGVERPARRASKPYAAVKIKGGRNACTAAVELGDTMFLAAQAPALPLGDCTGEQCACRYEFFDDRRQEDRRNPYCSRHGLVIGDSQNNQRAGADRRKAVK
jgi:hypothetical protein